MDTTELATHWQHDGYLEIETKQGTAMIRLTYVLRRLPTLSRQEFQARRGGMAASAPSLQPAGSTRGLCPTLPRESLLSPFYQPSRACERPGGRLTQAAVYSTL